MSNDVLGENIRRLRKEKGMTLQELALSLNISHVALSRYERNIRKPKSDMINLIAEKLGVDVDDLLLDPMIVRYYDAAIASYSEILRDGLIDIVNQFKIYVYFENELDENDLRSIADLLYRETKSKYNVYLNLDFKSLIFVFKYPILKHLATIYGNVKAQAILSYIQLDEFETYDELQDIIAPDYVDRVHDETLPYNKIQKKIDDLKEVMIHEYFKLELIDKIEILDNDLNVIKTIKH